MNSRFVHYGVLAALVGGALAVIIEIIEIFNPALAFTSVPVPVLRAVSMLLLAVGVWRLHTGQSPQGGRFSAVGALVMALGYLFAAAFVVSLIGAELPNFEDPAAAIAEMVSRSPFIGIALPFLLGGPVIFGIAAIRARVYPRWTGILLVLSPLVGFVVLLPGVPFIVGNIAEMLTPIVLGVMAWELWSVAPESTQEPASAS